MILGLISLVSILYIILQGFKEVGTIKNQYFLGELPCYIDWKVGYDKSAEITDKCSLFDTGSDQQLFQNALFFDIKSSQNISNIVISRGGNPNVIKEEGLEPF